MSVREAMLETYLLKQVEKQGGMTAKMAVPGRRGWPDRLVILPGGNMALVELKRAKRGVVSRIQWVMHVKLRRLGVTVALLNSEAQIDAFLARFAIGYGSPMKLWQTGIGDDYD